MTDYVINATGPIYDLVKRGLRDKAQIMWLSNESELGDLGVGGVTASNRTINLGWAPGSLSFSVRKYLVNKNTDILLA